MIRRSRGHTLTALRERDFAWYFFGNLSFFMAMQMGFLVRAFMAFDITDRAVAVGATSAGGAIATLTIAPLGGVVADRVNKRTLLIGVQVVSAGAALSLSLLILTDSVKFWHLVAFSFVFGGLFAMSMPSRQAVVSQLVPRHKLMNAVSLNMAGQALTAVVAPSLAGGLIEPIGPGWVYMSTVLLFVVGLPAVLQVPRHGMVAVARANSFVRDFALGLGFIRRDRTILMLILAGLFFPLVAFPVQQLSVVFADEVFDAGAPGFGLLVAGAGVGGFVGAMIAASLDNVTHKGRIIVLGGLSHGVLIMLYSQMPALVPAAVMLGMGFVGGVIFMTTNNSVVQAIVPEEVRGRVVAVLMMAFGTIQIGVLPLTLAADTLGPRTATLIWGGLATVLILGFFVLSRSIRTLRLDPLARAQLSPAQAARLVDEGKISQAEADRLSSRQSPNTTPATDDATE